MTIKDRLLHYFWGLFAQAFNASIAAVCSAAGIDTGKLIWDDLPKITPHLALAIFVGTFAWNCFFYFKAHPIPEEYPGGPSAMKTALASVIPPGPAKTDLIGAPPPAV